ncbi:hypothetical protein ACWW6E_003459 [Escherichia coli]
MNNEMFKYQLDELKEKHRVVCINVRGFDKNTKKKKFSRSMISLMIF